MADSDEHMQQLERSEYRRFYHIDEDTPIADSDVQAWLRAVTSAASVLIQCRALDLYFKRHLPES